METYRVIFEVAAESAEEAGQVAVMMKQTAQEVLECSLVNIDLHGEDIGDEVITVTLVLVGTKKIAAIKEIRSLCVGLGLKEAKDIVDHVCAGRGPVVLSTNLTPIKAQVTKKRFQDIDCIVRLESTRLPLHVLAESKFELRQLHEELRDWSG